MIDFKSIKIRECLIPRTEISAVEIKDDLHILKNLFVASGHSKLLIYRDNIDNIIGYVHSFDLFKNPNNIGEILRSINFIPETMMAHLALSMFIKDNKSVAVVVDEFGGTSGLVKNKPEKEFDYSTIDSLKNFEGNHPKVMEKRIEQKNWDFNFDPTKKNFGLKSKLLYLLEKATGLRPGEYKNYIKK